MFCTILSMKVKSDHRSKFSNLSNWKEEAWKISGLQRDPVHSSLSSATAVQYEFHIYFIYLVCLRIRAQGPVSRKSRKLFGPEKPFVKLRPAYCVKLVFSYVVKGLKIKITAKFRVSRRLRFEDTKRIMSPEKFRNFRETGPRAETWRSPGREQ